MRVYRKIGLEISYQMMQFWGATYVIGDTAKWGNAHPDRGMPAAGGKNQLFWKL